MLCVFLFSTPPSHSPLVLFWTSCTSSPAQWQADRLNPKVKNASSAGWTQIFEKKPAGSDLCSFLIIFLMIFSIKMFIFSMKISRFSLWKILMIFHMIFLMIHKIPYEILRMRVSGGMKTRWLGWQFLNGWNNAGRLGAGFISVCLETHWLSHDFCGYFVPEPYCRQRHLCT